MQNHDPMRRLQIEKVVLEEFMEMLLVLPLHWGISFLVPNPGFFLGLGSSSLPTLSYN